MINPVSGASHLQTAVQPEAATQQPAPSKRQSVRSNEGGGRGDCGESAKAES